MCSGAMGTNESKRAAALRSIVEEHAPVYARRPSSSSLPVVLHHHLRPHLPCTTRLSLQVSPNWAVGIGSQQSERAARVAPRQVCAWKGRLGSC